MSTETRTTPARCEIINVDGEDFTVTAWHSENDSNVWTDLGVIDEYSDLIAERVIDGWLTDAEVIDLAIEIEDRAAWASTLTTAVRDCGWAVALAPLAA